MKNYFEGILAKRMVMEKHTIKWIALKIPIFLEFILPHMTSTRTRNFDASIFWLITEETKAMEDKHRELYSATMLKKQGVRSSLLAACGKDLR
uniref:Uncharacterized protein n=1 Tax=Brassica oleracea var. oleracea TaxID=109376 RepID=A0A0D3BLN5_BRAOL